MAKFVVVVLTGNAVYVLLLARLLHRAISYLSLRYLIRFILRLTLMLAQFLAGARKSQQPTRTLQRQRDFLDQFGSLPFDDAAADQFGHIRAVLELAGTPIGPYDMQIAAIALVFGLIVITHNVREFGRVLDLQVEDWEE